MKTRNVITRQNQMCRNCLGEGVVTIPGFDHGHGHSQEPQTETCDVCNGSGMVVVEKKIEITVTPKASSNGCK